MRRPNNYDINVAVMLGPTDPDPTMDTSNLDIVKTVVQDSPHKLFIGGLPCDWTEDQVHSSASVQLFCRGIVEPHLDACVPALLLLCKFQCLTCVIDNCNNALALCHACHSWQLRTHIQRGNEAYSTSTMHLATLQKPFHSFICSFIINSVLLHSSGRD